MSRPVRSRRLMALFAAYVVALQALLLPLTVAAFAAPGLVLCRSADEATQQPVGQDTGCACAAGCGMQCCAPSLGSPPSQPVIVLRIGRSFAATSRPAQSAAARSSDRHSHSPRAPPVV